MTIDALNCSHHVMGESPWDFTPSTLLAAISLCGGSDAHGPEQVGRGFVDAERELRGAGITEVWTFQAGEFIRIELGAE